MRSKIIISAALLISFTLMSCGSKVQSGGNANDVAYDPTMAASYEVVGYNVLKNRLLVDFGLTKDDQAVKTLDANKDFFMQTNLTYSPIVDIKLKTIMAQACEAMDTDELFSDGANIDNAWHILTGRTASEGQQVQSEILAKLGSQPKDVQIYGLCMAASLNAAAIFVNYL